MAKIILASGSPRRKELLTLAGIEFDIIPAHGEEIITKTLPSEIVEELSLEKASEIADRYEKENGITQKTVVIGADTIVAYDNEIMGKPKDREDAIRMIKTLQNDTHQVFTGVTLIIMENNERRIVSFQEKTDVTMYPMSDEQILEYVDTKEISSGSDTNVCKYPWQDKAGGYGIQEAFGAKFISKIAGDYNNVVGLPVSRVYQELVTQNIFDK